MKISRIKYLLLASLLLFSISSCVFNNSIDSQDKEISRNTVDETTFQEYLWEEHTLDLFIQIGLLLAGAFGVAALLPQVDEE